MKKRWLILALIVVLIIGVQAIPAHVIANKTDYAANIGKQATFNAALDRFTVVSDPVEVTVDTLSAPENVISRQDIPDGLVVKILDCVRDNSAGIWWYRIEAAVGHTLPDVFPETPWIYQNNADYSGEDALILMDVAAAPETNSDPSKLVDPLTGVKVVSEELPQGATLQVESVDASTVLADFGADCNVVTSLDISVKTKNEKEWQPETTVTVQMPVAAQPGTTVGLLHTHEGKTSFLGVTEVSKNGTIAFETNGFSEFVAFTVDFHYQGVDFSIPGESSITLSALFEAMGINEDASKATSVVFSNPTLVAVNKIENNWELQSLVPFKTNETLIITFEDSHTILIDVTDSSSLGDYTYEEGKTYTVPDDYDYHIVVWVDKDKLPVTVKFTGGRKYWELHSEEPSGYGTLSDKSNQSTLSVTVKSGTPLGYKIAVQNKPLIGVVEGLGIVRVVDFVTFRYNKNGIITSTTAWPSNAANKKIGTWGMANTTAGTESRTNTFTISSTTPKAPGYTFDHWEYTDWKNSKTSVAPGGTVRLDDTSVNGDYVDFTAVWNKNTYTITYDEAGGTAVADQTYNVETNLTLQGAPTRDGYTFGGWSLSTAAESWSAGTYAAGKNMGQKNYGNITLTAIWNPIAYKVTLDKQGGSGGTDAYWYKYNTVSNGVYYYTDAGCTTALNNYTITKPTRAGYTFGGYYTAKNGGGTQYVDANGVCVNNLYSTVAANSTLYAKWTPITYTATFDPAGGSLSTTTGAFTIEGELVLPTPTRTGYTYVWKVTNASGNWTNGAEYTGSSVGTGKYGNVTLTAVWTPINYAITYDLAGGSLPGGKTNPATYTVETATFTLNNPVRAGYTFLGWTGSNGTTAQTSVSVAKGNVGERNYTANWQANNYILSFDYNGGANSANGTTTSQQTATYDSGNYCDVSWLNPAREGYQFAGWYTAAEGGTQVYDADGHAVTGAYWNSANKWIGTADLSMFAHWTPITYTVSFNANSGTGMEGQTQTYEYGTEYTLPQAGCTRIIKVTYQPQGGTDPNRTDELEATFLGWKVNNTGDLIADQATVSNLTSENGAQVVLYAQWAYKSVTLPATQWVGHTFKGWYDAAEGGTSIGVAGSTFTPTQDTVLYAQWAVVSYTITYQYNDGVSTDSIEEYNPDQAVTLYRTPARLGYRFDGWKLANGEGSWAAGMYAAGKAMGTGNYGNPVFVAQWSQQYRYVLKFDANGGTNAPATIIGDWQDAGTYSFTWSAVPTRANYRFVGWGESPDATANVAGEGKNTYSVTGVATQTVEKTLYAMWELESGHMELKYTGTGRPAVVTITGQGLTITTVVSTDTVISNLPAGEYTVTVSAAYASDEAAVSDPHPEVRPGEIASVGITTTERELNWFFGFCRCINRFLRNAR